MIQNLLATGALFVWLPVVIMIFSTRPARTAVITSFVFAWLFLPNIAWKLSGLPDYTKVSATIFGVSLCLVLFDLPRLMALRLQWFDVPVLVFCTCPFVTAMSVGSGSWDGLSATLAQMLIWGFPYLIGRVYFTDLESVRELAMGLVIGGLIYVPFCLIEIRLSPQFQNWVYGLASWEGQRMGGYRPKVFLQTGLELGMWMTCTTLLAQRLWASRAIKTFRGYPFSYSVIGLAGTTILCKSTGALVLLIIGLGILWTVTRTRTFWPIWLLIAVTPVYSASRLTGVFKGYEAVETLKIFGAERAQSVEFRFENEDILMRRAMQNPIFGGGRADGLTAFRADGRNAITDGYWIITLGQSGLVGLSSLITMSILPVILVARRHPASTWSSPAVAPAAGLGVMAALIMMDELSNAMMNPIYGMVLGSLTGLKPGRLASGLAQAELHLSHAQELAKVGRVLEAEPSFLQAIELTLVGDEGFDAYQVRAEALEGLGNALLLAGRPAEAEHILRDGLAIREALAAGSADDEIARDLAISRERTARALSELGRTEEAIALRQQALDRWDFLSSKYPADLEIRGHRVDAMNDLAWLLATAGDFSLRDPEPAVRFALEATRLDPDRIDCFNTLGVACYRAGDDLGAIEALAHSVASGPAGGTAFDYFFLAMAWHRLGSDDPAQDWFDRGVVWADHQLPGHLGLIRVREEAALLLARSKSVGSDLV